MLSPVFLDFHEDLINTKSGRFVDNHNFARKKYLFECHSNFTVNDKSLLKFETHFKL